MAALSIRPAGITDIDDLLSLLHLLFSIEKDFVFDTARVRHGLALMLASKQSVVLVAEESGQVIGMCTGQLTISTAEGGPALLVEDVVVRQGQQGRGVGRALLHALEGWARSRDIGRLQLLADRNNDPALAFYTKLGWQATELICLRRRPGL
ncbi:MAG: GNAT family N-acetyltransferase [Desulfobulbaceae bacterium]|mgnify:CR=1 FL=1|nr:MAG: GNAT family N-acetyltransferase [Desulfobulbaceae bacterium]